MRASRTELSESLEKPVSNVSQMCKLDLVTATQTYSSFDRRKRQTSSSSLWLHQLLDICISDCVTSAPETVSIELVVVVQLKSSNGTCSNQPIHIHSIPFILVHDKNFRTSEQLQLTQPNIQMIGWRPSSGETFCWCWNSGRKQDYLLWKGITVCISYLYIFLQMAFSKYRLIQVGFFVHFVHFTPDKEQKPPSYHMCQ